tara:strand:- start:625 stop:759 length:135 start_codon:yes stop_codon:yes gene_type:complete
LLVVQVVEMLMLQTMLMRPEVVEVQEDIVHQDMDQVHYKDQQKI